MAGRLLTLEPTKKVKPLTSTRYSRNVLVSWAILAFKLCASRSNSFMHTSAQSSTRNETKRNETKHASAMLMIAKLLIKRATAEGSIPSDHGLVRDFS